MKTIYITKCSLTVVARADIYNISLNTLVYYAPYNVAQYSKNMYRTRRLNFLVSGRQRNGCKSKLSFYRDYIFNIYQ